MIVGFTGVKQAGKDTCANHLVQKYGFEKLSFAAKMKEAVAALFDLSIVEVDAFKQTNDDVPYAEVILEFGTSQWSWTSSQWSWTWREFLQRFGTDMGRRVFGEHFWVNLLMEQIDFQVTTENQAICDVRFENEAAAIEQRQGIVIEVQRPGYTSDGHASEAGIPSECISYTLLNSGTIEGLYQDLDEIIADWGFKL